PDRGAPRLDVVPTRYGAFYTARRSISKTEEWHRINQFIFPFHSMITQAEPNAISLRSFVPIDDHRAMLISQHGRINKPFPVRPRLVRAVGRLLGVRSGSFDEIGGYLERNSDPGSYFMTKANRHNDYMRDRRVERESMFSGIPFVLNLQDRAMTEFMFNSRGEPICDRTAEHLGSSDAMIIAVRKQLLDALRLMKDKGSVPANVDEVGLDRVRPASMRMPVGADWKTLSESARSADSGEPPTAYQPTIG
ncbi:MAG TPA: hypothetical protein VMT64_05095, partial [Candidatus Binataceae bacterium]|nr:hypothetical protein [Candidatus Binataceae bacterium]